MRGAGLLIVALIALAGAPAARPQTLPPVEAPAPAVTAAPAPAATEIPQPPSAQTSTPAVTEAAASNATAAPTPTPILPISSTTHGFIIKGVLYISDGDFNAVVLKSALPSLVSFYAYLCANCNQMTPVLEELAGAYNGTMQVVKLNVQQSPLTTRAYQVATLPTTVLIKNQTVVTTIIGPAEVDVVNTAIVPFLGDAPAAT